MKAVRQHPPPHVAAASPSKGNWNAEEWYSQGHQEALLSAKTVYWKGCEAVNKLKTSILLFTKKTPPACFIYFVALLFDYCITFVSHPYSLLLLLLIF